MPNPDKWILRAQPNDAKEVETDYSRNRKNVITLFDVYCEVNGLTDEPTITYSYPPDFQDQALFNSIRRFAFPSARRSEMPESAAVQQFSFVLTEGTGNFTYAYCRLAPSTGVCSCILSGYCYTTLFYGLLNHMGMARAAAGGQENLELILSNGYHVEVPNPGEDLVLNHMPKKNLHFTCPIPNESTLPMLNDDKVFMEFFNGVEDKQMIALFTALLFERRIVVTGKKLGPLTSCCFALTRLLYPFRWQYTFIPLLPQHLLDTLSMPMPFIIGLPKQLYESVKSKGFWSDFVLFDLDGKVFESPHQDCLPSEVAGYLKQNLKLSTSCFHSDNFSRTFLRAIALLFGQYKSGFTLDPKTKENVYDLENPFLRKVMLENGASYFDGYVTGRLVPSEKNRILDEEFEKEICAVERKQFTLQFLQANAPEAFHNAMSNVKDGATDVLGSLRGKVQSLVLKDPFSLAPKHKRKKKKPQNIDPLSVDTSQYGIGMASESQDEGDSPQSADVAVEEEPDLIDFSEPTPSKELNFEEMLKPSSSSVPNLYPALPSTSTASSASSNRVSLPQTNGTAPERTLSYNFQQWQKFE
ncbi:UDENN domain-containing protein [Aphelenchoides fujianensis]|nr:UDENN domain-containing protein [Aphelenchoides fujianensis]